MRLSDVLNMAPDGRRIEVENFLGTRRIRWGQHKIIKVGTVLHNFYCRTCTDLRTFASGESLSCLIAGEQLISIDATLRCPGCGTSVETWYLVVSDGDLYSYSPVVYLQRYCENRRNLTSGVGTDHGQFEDLIERAQLAYESQRGAGSMVYLRQIFESITTEVATIAGISATSSKGSRKPFRQLLEEVDKKHQIIPTKFSSNGYRLFSELSEVLHGHSSEDIALIKYPPCKQLILSVISNVKSDRLIAGAIEALGWDVNELESIAGEEVIS